MAYTCPRCKKTSQHPDDEANGYCGNCHDFTSVPVTLRLRDTEDARARMLADGIPPDVVRELLPE